MKFRTLIVSLALLLFSVRTFSQQDLLRDKCAAQLRAIAERTDAIVGYAVKDLTTGTTFFSNEKEIFPTASAIKLFILAEVYRQAEEKKFSLSDVRPFPSAFRTGGSGILSLLSEKSVSMSLRDYCVLMMNQSDNSATNFLIDLVGLKSVNTQANALGCTSTQLQRVMMDSKAVLSGKENISTPSDLLLYLEKLSKGQIVSSAASTDMLSIMRLEKDGWIKSGVPSDVSVANKAGDVDGVKCDAAIVELKGHPYAIVVMTKYLPADVDGGAVITEISQTVFRYFERTAASNAVGRRLPQ